MPALFLFVLNYLNVIKVFLNDSCFKSMFVIAGAGFGFWFAVFIMPIFFGASQFQAVDFFFNQVTSLFVEGIAMETRPKQ